MNWLKRLFSGTYEAFSRATSKSGEKPPRVTAENRAEAQAEIDAYLRAQIAAAFSDEKDLIEGAAEYLGDQYDSSALRRLARERVGVLLVEQRAAESTWPAITDCDRLERAFAALEARGIVCRQDFSCCGNCGHAEIGDEIESTRAKGRQVRGYAFYHMQDTERAVEGGGIYLAYGSAEGGASEAIGIAQEICAAISEESLSVVWDGTVERRILVPLDWKRRRKPKCSAAS